MNSLARLLLMRRSQDAGKIITAMNVTVDVPSNPRKVGADPSFWFGLQTAEGTGALIQPILAWARVPHPHLHSHVHCAAPPPPPPPELTESGCGSLGADLP